MFGAPSGPGAAPAPAFQRIAILGLGAVGGSLAMAVRQAWPGVLVIGVDTHDAIEAAIRMHAVDVGADDLMIAGGADLLVLAGDAEANARALRFLPEAVGGDAVVLALACGDAAVDEARALPERLPVVAGEPSIDLPGGGIQAASAALVQGRPWRVWPVTAGAEPVRRVHDLVAAIGGRLAATAQTS